MPKTTLKIQIAEDGAVNVQVAGVAGPSCLDATKFLEDAMGGGVQAQEMTEEFYQTSVETGITQGEG